MDTIAGRLESVNASHGGVPKTGVFEALITEEGLDGDRQATVPPHGGPDRAIVLFSLDVIRALQREGHPIAAGTAGENFTISGVEWGRSLLATGCRSDRCSCCSRATPRHAARSAHPFR